MAVHIQPASTEKIKAMLRPIIRLHNCIKGGRIAGRLTKELGIGIFSEANRRNWKANARIGGLIGGKTTAAIPGHMTKAATAAGRANVESGHIAALGRLTAELQIGVHDPKVREIATSMGGKIQGLQNVLSGHMERFKTRETCSLGGRVNAHRNHHVPKNRFNPKCDFCIGVSVDKNAN
jgi:hypothetical protein